MSHYTNLPFKNVGQPLVNKEFTHVLRVCWGCGVRMAQQKTNEHRRKICYDCSDRLSPEEIKKVYSIHYNHMRDQLQAKKTRPDNDRFIFNSPFREQKK